MAGEHQIFLDQPLRQHLDGYEPDLAAFPLRSKEARLIVTDEQCESVHLIQAGGSEVRAPLHQFVAQDFREEFD